MIQKEFIRLGERIINLNLIRHIEFQKDILCIKFVVDWDEEFVFKFEDERDWQRCETYLSMYTTKFDGAREQKVENKSKKVE